MVLKGATKTANRISKWKIAVTLLVQLIDNLALQLFLKWLSTL
jgi:hypothetical protein